MPINDKSQKGSIFKGEGRLVPKRPEYDFGGRLCLGFLHYEFLIQLLKTVSFQGPSRVLAPKFQTCCLVSSLKRPLL